MDNRAFSLAKNPTPVTVLKMPLRAFSIGHRLLLERCESPFIIGGTCHFSDLITAVLICSHTYEDAANLRNDFWLPLKIKLWSHSFRSVNIAQELQAFRGYLNAGHSCPKLKPGEGRAPGGPYLQRLVNFLQFKIGKTESEAWNYPLALAQWEWATYFEEEGGLKIQNAADDFFDKWTAEQDAFEAQSNLGDKAYGGTASSAAGESPDASSAEFIAPAAPDLMEVSNGL